MNEKERKIKKVKVKDRINRIDKNARKENGKEEKKNRNIKNKNKNKNKQIPEYLKECLFFVKDI